MKIKTLIVGELRQNCYICYDAEAKNAVLIDPGAEFDKITAFLEENSLTPEAVLLTHAHYDHIGACEEIKQRFNIPVHMFRTELDAMCGYTMNEGRPSVVPDILLDDNDNLFFGKLRLKVIHTPGHSCGSVCYYNEDYGYLFSGDTLFREEIGRCDLHTGNFKEILQAIAKQLFKLPDDTRVYPGHGLRSNIGHEKVNNPYFTNDAW